MDYVDRMAGRSARFNPDTLLKFTPLYAHMLQLRLLVYRCPPDDLDYFPSFPESSRACALTGGARCRSRPVQQHLTRVYFTLACALVLAALGTWMNLVTGFPPGIVSILGFVGCATWLAATQPSSDNLNKRCAAQHTCPSLKSFLCRPVFDSFFCAAAVRFMFLSVGKSVQPCHQVSAAGGCGVQPGRHTWPPRVGCAGGQPGAAAHRVPRHGRRVCLLQRCCDAVTAALVPVPGRLPVLGACCAGAVQRFCKPARSP